mmetsp:Transcript_36863/g.80845  ORF Transcript_36863/g.80845 Transcript_36863/m.80845 type:complete len:401 (+) Transcript_36863:58-1260(+)
MTGYGQCLLNEMARPSPHTLYAHNCCFASVVRGEQTCHDSSAESTDHGDTELDYSSGCSSGNSLMYVTAMPAQQGEDAAGPTCPVQRTAALSLSLEASETSSASAKSSAEASVPSMPLPRGAASPRSSPSHKLRLRNGFLEVAEGPEAKVRSSSAPPSMKYVGLSIESIEKPNLKDYLQELEDRARVLGTAVKKPCEKKAHRTSYSSQTSTASASMDNVESGSTSLHSAEISPLTPRSNASIELKAKSSPSLMEPAIVEDVHSMQQSSEQPIVQKLRRRGRKSAAAKRSDERSSQPITTLMLGNLPYRATKKSIIEALCAMDFEDTFDFVYVPNANDERPRATNLGYGFINFLKPSFASAFEERFDSFTFPGMTSSKTCTVKPARVQRSAAMRGETTELQ